MIQKSEGYVIKDFWEDCHINKSKRYLTGSQGEEVWNNLQVKKYMFIMLKDVH